MEGKMIVQLPMEDIQKIVSDAPDPVGALGKLNYPWCIVVKGSDEKWYIIPFEDQAECAAKVADYHGSADEVVYVLKNGIPRKSIKVEISVKFR